MQTICVHTQHVCEEEKCVVKPHSQFTSLGIGWNQEPVTSNIKGKPSRDYL